MLEGSGHGEPESLARFSQQEAGAVGIDCQMISVVTGRARREHGAGNRNRRIGLLVEPQRVIGPIDTERRVHHRQEHLQFESGRGTRPPVRRTQNLQIVRRRRIQDFSTLAIVASIEDWTSEFRPDHLIILHLRDLQLGAPNHRVDARVDEDRARKSDLQLTFLSKAKALELAEVKNCPDPRIATKIRKAKSAFEVGAWVTLALLKSLTPEQWKHYGMHAERGQETIEHIVRMFAGHDLNHMQQIERILAGK